MKMPTDQVSQRMAADDARPFKKSSANVVIASLLALIATEVPKAEASVVIGSTRVVYEAGTKQTSLRFENKNDHPSLMQVWIDSGDVTQSAEEAEVPFSLIPPVFRIESGRQQVVRLSHTGESMPPDRESLYWINALEVPPSADEEESPNRLQIAFRSRLKLLYRPQDLTPSVQDAPKSLIWRATSDAQGTALEVENPTPYHLSFSKVEIVAGTGNGQALLTDDPKSHMVKPFSTLRLQLPSGAGEAPANALIRATVIDDYGALVPVEKAMARN